MDTQRHFLIADSSPVLRGLIREVLRWSGFTSSVEAANYGEAETLLFSFPVDMILMSAQIEGLAFGDPVRRIGRIPGCADKPIMVVPPRVV
ncbi:hypothetical protein [Magnetospirillum sp. UT-4]|uniref:hypothetical protein n=1 Tax=Magnetospirillum sp. UT-4 TaxID=2681467 RepID=UPI001383DC81|nr:hypothetical protein [Magnetospirillum sp. UT-4]CAA7625259.1 hypothetical protein MTBUT4_660009 [Magnetospirillum sp. UT-4]